MSSIRCISYLFLSLPLYICLRLSYLENHCSVPAAATVVGGRPRLQLSSALFGPEFRLRFRLRLMPNASKLFAPIVRGRAQYCVANVPPNVQLSTGSWGASSLATPRMNARHGSAFVFVVHKQPCHAMSWSWSWVWA